MQDNLLLCVQLIFDVKIKVMLRFTDFTAAFSMNSKNAKNESSILKYSILQVCSGYITNDHA